MLCFYCGKYVLIYTYIYILTLFIISEHGNCTARCTVLCKRQRSVYPAKLTPLGCRGSNDDGIGLFCCNIAVSAPDVWCWNRDIVDKSKPKEQVISEGFVPSTTLSLYWSNAVYPTQYTYNPVLFNLVSAFVISIQCDICNHILQSFITGNDVIIMDIWVNSLTT